MYKYAPIYELIKSTEAAITKPIDRFGICVYVDCNPDDVGPDTYIDPADTEGIKIFRKFAAEFAAHLKTLKIKS